MCKPIDTQQFSGLWEGQLFPMYHYHSKHMFLLEPPPSSDGIVEHYECLLESLYCQFCGMLYIVLRAWYRLDGL